MKAVRVMAGVMWNALIGVEKTPATADSSNGCPNCGGPVACKRCGAGTLVPFRVANRGKMGPATLEAYDQVAALLHPYSVPEDINVADTLRRVLAATRPHPINPPPLEEPDMIDRVIEERHRHAFIYVEGPKLRKCICGAIEPEDAT